MAEVWQTSDITNEALNELFDAAYMDSALDDKGRVVVSESGLRLWVEANKSGKSIQFDCYFYFKDTTNELQRLKFVNDINSKYVLVRAYNVNNVIIVDYTIRADGGITKKSVVLAFKFFAEVCSSALREDPEDLLD